MAESMQPDVAVRVSDDQMVVWVDCRATNGDLGLLARQLRESLAQLGAGGDLDEPFLAQWLKERYGDGQPFTGAVLLEGVRPVMPVDGRVVWAAPFFEKGFHIDEETGVIDYRERSARRSVQAGDSLAEVIPSKEGSDGCDVFGRRIHVPKATPVKIFAGENVHREDDAGRFVADCDGRVCWDGGELSVDTVYRIPGNVGLETGNVSHLGAIEVEGDVEQGSRVESRGDIEVKQVVEAADIQCGANLTVRGGIAGAPGHLIRVAGSIHARFILEADIEAGGDIVVEREIMRSTLKARGAIIVPRGRLIGGEIVALKGIRVAQTGSVASVPTVLCSGEDYALMKEIAEKEAEFASVTDAISRIEPVLGPALSRIAHMPKEKQQAVGQLAAKMAGLKRQAHALQEEIEAIRNRSKDDAVHVIEVLELVCPDTTFILGGERLHVREELAGPLKAVLRKGRVELRGASDSDTDTDA